MKTPRIANAVGHIDDDLISAAAESKNKTGHNYRLKRISAAACFAVLIIAGTAILPSFFKKDGSSTDKYKYQIAGTEADMEWPWKYKTNAEKYRVINFNGKRYNIKSGNTIGADNFGSSLGFCEAEGIDTYTDKRYTEIFEIRKINGVSEEKMIAAGNASGFYVYAVDGQTKPDTFGEILDLYGLSQNLEFRQIANCEGYDEKGYLSLNDDTFIWQILSNCRDAKLYKESDSFDWGKCNYLAFTVTSEALGVYKNVVCISEDGYFETNIFDYSYIYFIGEEAAAQIIDYALNNSDTAEFSPYALTVSGTLTEIGDGYVLIDDTVLCRNPKAATVYKVFTDDIRAKRCIECACVKVGDTVVVKYEGEISENNEVSGAYSIYAGILKDGDVLTAE